MEFALARNIVMLSEGHDSYFSGSLSNKHSKLQMFLAFTFNFSFYKCNFLCMLLLDRPELHLASWVITLLSTNLFVAVVVLIVLINNEAFIYWRIWSCLDFIFPNVSWKVSLFIFFWLLMRTLVSKIFLKSSFLLYITTVY